MIHMMQNSNFRIPIYYNTASVLPKQFAVNKITVLDVTTAIHFTAVYKV